MSKQLNEILSKFQNVRPTGRGYLVNCPCHEDNTASLGIMLNKRGEVNVHCFAGCLESKIVAAIKTLPAIFSHNLVTKKDEKRITNVYGYFDENKRKLFEVVRFEPKGFMQRQPNPNGGYIYNLDGVRRVLFKLPELIASDPQSWVFIVEGEKDVCNLMNIGLVATTSSCGSNCWHLTDSKVLNSRKIAILPDNDKSGKDYALQIANDLINRAKEVKIIELPNLPEKGDVSDWLDLCGTKEQLLELVDKTELFKPNSKSCPEHGGITILDQAAPLTSARKFLAMNYVQDGIFTFWNYAENAYSWNKGCYRQFEKGRLRNEVYNFCENAVQVNEDNDNEVRPFKPNKSKVDQIIDALKAATHLPAHLEPPCWLNPSPDLPNPINVFATQNKLVDLNSGCIMQPTPKFFTMIAADYDYDPHAPVPMNWLSFLESLWKNDAESIATLQEWFGYCLTPDTRQQKMLLLIGPKRAGKGCITRTLTLLLGKHNVVSPTMASFTQGFGLENLIGKTLATISDARLAGYLIGNQSSIIERLLSISGEDALSIDRKYKEAVTFKLSARIMIATNELPRLQDHSDALSSRFIVLRLTESFFGKENMNLTEQLAMELPGILLWAIDGRNRLLQRGHFMQPKSSQSTIEEFEELTNPIKAFVNEKCVLGNQHVTPINALYAEYLNWCEATGRNYPGDVQTFGRNLKSYLPNLVVVNSRIGTGRVREYKGIGLQRKRVAEF